MALTDEQEYGQRTMGGGMSQADAWRAAYAAFNPPVPRATLTPQQAAPAQPVVVDRVQFLQQQAERSRFMQAQQEQIARAEERSRAEQARLAELQRQASMSQTRAEFLARTQPPPLLQAINQVQDMYGRAGMVADVASRYEQERRNFGPGALGDELALRQTNGGGGWGGILADNVGRAAGMGLDALGAVGRGIAQMPISLYQPMPVVSPYRGGQAEPRTLGETGQNVYAGLRTEIPYAAQTARMAGDAIRGMDVVADKLAYVPPFVPGGQVPFAIGVAQQAGKRLPFMPTPTGLAAEVVETSIPTEVWMAALELVPGVGTVPDLMRLVKNGDGVAIRALREAMGSPRVRSVGRTLASERGSLELGDDAGRIRELRRLIAQGEKEFDVAVGAEKRAAILAQLDRARTELAQLQNKPLPGASASTSSTADALGSPATASRLTPVTEAQPPPEIRSAKGSRPSGRTTRQTEPSEALRGETTTENDIAGSVAPEPGAVPSEPVGGVPAVRDASSRVPEPEAPPDLPADTIEVFPGGDEAAERALRGQMENRLAALGDDDGVARYVFEPELLDDGDRALARSGRPRLLPFAQSMDDAASRLPNTPGTKIAETLARIPGAKGVMGLFNRSAYARVDPASALATLYRRVLTQGEHGVHYGVGAYLRDRPYPFRTADDGAITNLPAGSRFGPKLTTALTPPGTTTGGFQGEHILDVMERATRADVGKHLTEDQWGWIQTARNLVDDALDDLVVARGLKPGSAQADAYLQHLGFAPGEHYFPRNVIGREGIEGARRATSGQPRASVGARQFYEKSRLHEYVAEGLARGLDYADPRVSLENYLMAIRRQTADEYLLSAAKTFGRTRKQLGVGEDAYIGAISGVKWGRPAVVAARESAFPGLSGYIFPADVIDTLEGELAPAASNWLRIVGQLTGAARTFKAGFDIGAPFIQGWPLLIRNPVAWARATSRSYRALANPAVRAQYLLDNRAHIQSYLDNGGELTTPEMLDALRSGGLLQAAQNNPAGRRAAAVFDTFMDVARIEYWKALSTGAKDADKPLLMGNVRNLIGTPSLVQAGIQKTQGSILNDFMFFATRYTASPFALVSNLLGTRASAQESVRAITSMLAGTSITLYAFGKAMGMSDEELRDMFDPGTGKRFMSVRVGDNYIGVGGVYRSLMQLAANSYVAAKDDPQAFTSVDFRRNPLLYWFRSRTSPFTGTAITLATGADFTGNLVNSWDDRIKELAQNFTPLSVDAFVDAEGPAQSRLIAAGASFAGLRQVSLNDRDRLDIARDEGARLFGFSTFEKMAAAKGRVAAVQMLNESSPELAALDEAVRKQGMERREERGYRSLGDALEPFLLEQQEADANPDLQDPQAWIADRKARRQRQAGAISAWAKDNPDQVKKLTTYDGDPFALPVDASPDDLRAAYLTVFKSHETPTGGVDDQEALSADLDRFEAQLSDEQQAALDANLGQRKTDREKAYAQAAKMLDEAGYYDRRDTAFEEFKRQAAASRLPAERKALIAEMADVDSLRRWAQEEVVAQGYGPENYDKLPEWKAWTSIYGDANQVYLVEHPEIDVLAVLWGYQTRVHSPEAARLYEEQTGLKAPVPAN